MNDIQKGSLYEVICVHKNGLSRIGQNDDVTIGFKYFVYKHHIPNARILIKDDTDLGGWYPMDNFMTLDEYREAKIDNVLS